ncbi:hypothetical protein [Klebsiella aerogenes]|uniref:hypothetical protein n=1 Tax=Klebsiella aerogenes TaxID=548 RepID=UPI00375369A3
MHKSSRLWERFEDSAHDNGQQMTSIAKDAITALELAEVRITQLEREEGTLRPVGVMSEKAFRRLENRESRFIALWPRPEIYLPRKRPNDGVIVYARTVTPSINKREG